MTVVVGELTADGRDIVVMGAGDLFTTRFRVPKALMHLTPLVRRSEPPGAHILPATWPTVVQLANEFGQGWQPGPRLREWIAEQVRQRTTPRQGFAVDLPEGLKPYPWQVEGAELIANIGKVLITDEAGTGKTITTILGLLARGGGSRPLVPTVVVAPASVVDSWVEAWRRWAPQVRVVAWRGTKTKRRALTGTAEVYVTSYDTARMDALVGSGNGRSTETPLADIKPRAVVIDECHLIKNPHAHRSLAVRKLAKDADTVVALSGTPITHNPADLWPTLVALDPDSWPSRNRWIERYCDVYEGAYAQEIGGLSRWREPEFRTTLLGQHRRIAKADVLSQLPPKVYSVRTVELPREYRKAYDEMERDMLAKLPDGGEISVMSVLAQLTRLAQMASAAADVQVTVEEDEEGRPHETINVRLKAPSWKVDALLEILAERPGQPVVAFAPSRQLIKLAGEAAEKSGYKVGYIVGDQTPSERTRTVELFQAGKLDLACVTTGAGGVGLTLTAARTAVFLQRPWSIVEATQAEDRVHRIGSERHDSVEIIDIVARNTIDSRVREVLREKADQLADLVQDKRIVTQLLGGDRNRSKKGD